MTTSRFLLEHLTRSGTVSLIRKFFHALCGLSFGILDTEGYYVSICPSRGTLPCGVPLRHKACGMPGCRTAAQCLVRRKDCLKGAAEKGFPQDFCCPRGHKNIFMPVARDGQVIAYLRVGEEAAGSLDHNRLELISSFLKELVDRILHDELKFLYDLKSDRLTSRQKLVNQILDDVRANYNRNDLTLRELSKHNAVSYHCLSRIFSKELHTSFPKFRNKMRMEMAEKLLKNRSLSVEQISRLSGFDDPGYFCKVFKRTFGRPPVSLKGARQRPSAKNSN